MSVGEDLGPLSCGVLKVPSVGGDRDRVSHSLLSFRAQKVPGVIVNGYGAEPQGMHLVQKEIHRFKIKGWKNSIP